MINWLIDIMMHALLSYDANTLCHQFDNAISLCIIDLHTNMHLGIFKNFCEVHSGDHWLFVFSQLTDCSL